MTKLQLVLVLNVIVEQSGAVFLDQSRCESDLKRNQSDPGFLLHKEIRE